MKKPFFALLSVGASAVFLGGCPVFPDNDNLPDGWSSTTCSTSSECPSGYSCYSDGYCRADSNTGDCTRTGCDVGFTCLLQGGSAICVDSSTIGSDGGTSTTDAGGDSSKGVCHRDAECSSVSGSKCLNGTCVAPSSQCSDFTQCVAGSQCVEGVCTPTCNETKPCPTGYGCDGNGVCTLNPTPCAEAGNECTGGKTCVEERCVDPCASTADGGAACAGDLVCEEGGCAINETPSFVCDVEGEVGTGNPKSCAVGSVCIHHNCYIACDQDAGDACKTSDAFNVCKQVTSASVNYSVCGSATNLGSECDPTAGKACLQPKVCIDGFCK